MGKFYFAIAVGLLASCAAVPPGAYNVDRSKPFNQPYDQLWETLVGFLATRNIQIKNIAKDSGVIYGEQAAFDDNIADCGVPGGLERQVSRVGTFNIFVARSGEQPVVTVNTKFSEIRRSVPISRYETPRSWSVDCPSKGMVERAILAVVN